MNMTLVLGTMALGAIVLCVLILVDLTNLGSTPSKEPVHKSDYEFCTSYISDETPPSKRDMPTTDERTVLEQHAETGEYRTRPMSEVVDESTETYESVPTPNNPSVKSRVSRTSETDPRVNE